MDAFSGSNFVGPALPNFLTKEPRVLAQIKTVPSDFIVEEQTTHAHKTSINPDPDLSQEQLDAKEGTGTFCSFTMVTRQLTSYEGCLRLYRELRRLGPMPRREKQISQAGMKDRWAITSQCCHSEDVPIEHLRAVSRPRELTGPGFFIKDIARATKHLRPGHLVANHFRIRVSMPGMTKEEIEAYIQPRVELFAQRGFKFPNFYNRQRLGRRQNIPKVIKALLSDGPEEAIRLYLCDTSDLENPAATTVRKRLAETWDQAAEEARETGTSIAEQDIFFHIMLGHLDKHTQLNLANEYTLVNSIHSRRNLNDVLRDNKEKICGMWFGAYQSYWHNRALERVIRNEIVLEDGKIPLYIKDKSVEDWYRRNGMADAVVDNVDPFVKELFLTPPRRKKHSGKHGFALNRRHANKSSQVVGPRRNAFVTCRDFAHHAEDGSWHVQFALESGAYATTVLQMFVDLSHDDELDDKEA